jgi:sulfhydrogenase subunit beta (sulfur reductase)
MEKQKLLQKVNLNRFLDGLIKSGKSVIAPKKKGSTYYFAPVSSPDEIALDYIQTSDSAKSVVFPRVEELFRYTYEGNDVKLGEPEPLKKEYVLFGMRPCDASSFSYLKDFFLKENPDFHFQRRLDHTTFITLSCNKFDDACFCTSVGVNPGDVKGSDIALTDTGNDFYVEILSEKGDALLNQNAGLFTDTGKIDKTPFLANPPVRFNVDQLTGAITSLYDNPEWQTNSLACLSCGACAFNCPTCTCFDIQDESNPMGGSRLRCWDACALGLFTLHASGHNPREVQTERWRHRVKHKFEYSVNNLDMVSCVGCGRCIRVCPAQMNILEQITSLV